MTTCLLCPSPAVADGLCVEDGVKKWAADLWERDMHEARKRVNGAREGAAREDERELAVCQIDGPHHARAFLDKLDAARKVRAEQGVRPWLQEPRGGSVRQHRMVSVIDTEASMRCRDCGLECAPRPKGAKGPSWLVRWRKPGDAWAVQKQPRPCPGKGGMCKTG